MAKINIAKIYETENDKWKLTFCYNNYVNFGLFDNYPEPIVLPNELFAPSFNLFDSEYNRYGLVSGSRLEIKISTQEKLINKYIDFILLFLENDNKNINIFNTELEVLLWGLGGDSNRNIKNYPCRVVVIYEDKKRRIAADILQFAFCKLLYETNIIKQKSY
jgi:hypothetical protein